MKTLNPDLKVQSISESFDKPIAISPEKSFELSYVL